MSERELDELNFRMAYYSKGKLPIQWLEGVSYRRRSFIVDLLIDQLNKEAKEYEEFRKEMKIKK